MGGKTRTKQRQLCDPLSHFERRLRERCQLTLAAQELLLISKLIRQKRIRQVTEARAEGTAVFEYYHSSESPKKPLRRIYIVAEVCTGRLISVQRSAWVKRQQYERK